MDSARSARATTLQDIASVAAWGLARELLVAVAQRPRAVSELADDVELEVATVSRCLRSLLRADLVTCRKERRRHVYSAGPRLASDRRANTLVLTLTAGSRARVVLEFSEAELWDLRRSERPGAPADGGASPPAVAVRPGAVPAPRGGGRRPAHPASGPGS